MMIAHGVGPTFWFVVAVSSISCPALGLELPALSEIVDGTQVTVTGADEAWAFSPAGVSMTAS